nr:cardiolipin synthase [Bacillus weihaiensis]
MGSAIFVCFIVLTLVVAWVCCDYHAGRKDHLMKSKYTKYPLRMSDIDLYTDGTELYTDLFEQINKCTKRIHVLIYIVKNDDISHEFLDLLSKKASEGLDVRLLLDYVGSAKLGKKKIREIQEKGVRVAFSHKPKFPYLFYTSQARNHRKITVLDGKTAYLGGFNIGKEYIGLDPKLGYWRDYHLKIAGEGVEDLQVQFLKDWFDSTGEDDRGKPSYLIPQMKGKSSQLFISTYGMHLDDHFIHFIQQAKREIIICSPYFIPGKVILDELLAARSRGVNVQIMVPLKEDHPLVKEASMPYFKPLLLAGCEIYQFFYGFFHAKVIVIDDHFCDIGTANFDKRSMYLNDEMNCIIYDHHFIQKVKDKIISDFKKSELLTYQAYQKRPFTHKVKEKFATLISHFL